MENGGINDVRRTFSAAREFFSALNNNGFLFVADFGQLQTLKKRDIMGFVLMKRDEKFQTQNDPFLLLGLIIPMGEKILQAACHFNKQRIDSGCSPLRVAVNLSARQFQQRDLFELVQGTLTTSQLDPQWLELEVTESMMMQDEKQAIALLKRLRDLGISISMDDFGTGYSSLSYLKRLPIQALKIDQSFVRELSENSDDAAIVMAIVSMAKSLKLHVVAEGVETKEQAEFLEKIECDELQGYYFSRPLPEDAFQKFVATRSSV